MCDNSVTVDLNVVLYHYYIYSNDLEDKKENKMKYVLGATLVALAITGCTSTPNKEVTRENVIRNAPENTQVISFVGPNDLKLYLKSSDLFETAQMIDGSGEVYHLKRAVSGSGVRLANDDGVSIHFKGGEGIVEFEKDKPISITEVKK